MDYMKRLSVLEFQIKKFCYDMLAQSKKMARFDDIVSIKFRRIEHTRYIN